MKLQAWGLQLIKKSLQHRCFPVNIAKVLRTPILKNVCERLFLRLEQWGHNIWIFEFDIKAASHLVATANFPKK